MKNIHCSVCRFCFIEHAKNDGDADKVEPISTTSHVMSKSFTSFCLAQKDNSRSGDDNYSLKCRSF